MKYGVLVAVLFSLAIPFGAQAYVQNGVDEIVVTGMRAIDWSPDEIPVAQLKRRADNLVVEVRVVNDTRDAVARRNEITQTLRRMSQMAATRNDIALSMDNDGQLVPLTADMLSTLTLGVDGSRADTSVARVTIKTPVRADDTLDTASQRLESFVKGVDMVGRSLASVSGDWELSLVNPAQYRPAILALIAEDSRAVVGTFGDGYAVEVEGIASPVAWRQSGSLELSLFIPYKMKVTPKP